MKIKTKKNFDLQEMVWLQCCISIFDSIFWTLRRWKWAKWERQKIPRWNVWCNWPVPNRPSPPEWTTTATSTCWSRTVHPYSISPNLLKIHNYAVFPKGLEERHIRPFERRNLSGRNETSLEGAKKRKGSQIRWIVDISISWIKSFPQQMHFRTLSPIQIEKI